METKKNVEERVLKAKSGMGMLIFSILLILLCAPVIVVGVKIRLVGLGIVLGVILVLTGFILLGGLHIIHPNEALVLTLFGNYYGTLYDAGFYWINPFCSAINPTAQSKIVQEKEKNSQLGKSEISISVSKKVSLKTMTLDNKKQIGYNSETLGKESRLHERDYSVKTRGAGA